MAIVSSLIYKLMKKFFTLMVVAVMMSALPAKAQFGWGLRGGVNLTSLSFSSAVFDKSNRAGFFVGPTVKFTVPIVGVGVDVSALYDQRNSGIEGQTVVEKNVFVPINVRYQYGLGSSASVFLKVGPQFGWNVGDKTFQLNSETITNVKNQFTLKNSNISLNVGLGATVFKHLELGITYNIALGKTGEVSYWDAAKSAYSQVTKTRTNCWQLNLAYYF